MNDFLKKEYGLKKQPFYKLTPEEKPEFIKNMWVNREKELTEWHSILDKAKESNCNHFVFIIGSYGRGKTHSLLKVKCDVESEYKKMLPIFFNFQEEQSTKPIKLIFQIFRNIDFRELGKSNRTKIKNEIMKMPEHFGEPLKIFHKLFFDKDQNVRDTALYFIRGELKPSRSDLKELEVKRKIDDLKIAKEYLLAFLYLIKRIGYTTLVLIIDEFEYIFSLISKSNQSKFIALFRGLYDLPTGFMNVYSEDIANMVYFAGISEDGIIRLELIEKKEVNIGGPTLAFKRRIDAKTVLGKLKKEDVRKLIEKRLRCDRIGHFRAKPLIPFNEGFVDYINDRTHGNPGYIIKDCGKVLNQGIRKRIKLLTKEFAISVFKETSE